ncbi:translation initiation factor IF-2 [Petroclostridium sp. X23]|uniref:translation initiation factor IF-2 n=1 Tax=Petroclostridium sp. X23 TaxID=3045146 RepID=UPI0024AE0E2F|nr:translation initiation factor IF-2 [Petroclostridium sp. X23]WHH58979.1 translation initiation factor IF-2 [Petroclostridium sp. X23]
MSKPRVYEIAKDLDISSKDIISELQKFDVDVKNHMSTLEDSDIDIILETYTQQNDVVNNQETQPKPEKKAEQNAADYPTKENKKNIEQKNVNQTREKDANDKNKKGRYVDTRPTVVDLDKLDTEKIEELVPDKVKFEGDKKQKIKKSVGKSKKDKGFEENIDKVQAKNQKPKKDPMQVAIPDEIMVGDLADKLKVSATEIIKKLMMLGVMATINQTVDFDTASVVAEDLGAKVEKEVIITEEDKLFNDVEDDDAELKTRPPVVVVMGHVDHGKTSLLDAIRETDVIATEAGGITQHIGAYRVKIHDKDITFLDTPGHEAFTAMRARGAQVTDIAILVVAADDGIMPQTVEAINHAKAANVNIIIAINKMDKEGANPDRVKQELTEYGLVPEEWGGDTICVPVSALKKEGIDHLLEMILLVSEMQELKANPNRLAKGTVVEAQLDKGRGPVATVLVQNGTLKIGDILVAGTAVGRVRAMVDDKGQRVKKAGPSTPVEILGLSEVPDGGDVFYAVEDEKKARDVVEKRKDKIKEEKIQSHQRVSLDDLFNQIKEGQVKDLNIIIKGDVQGSVEAVKQSLEKLSNSEVRVRTIHGGVGAITESDVVLAAASNAIIIGFNVRPDAAISASAEQQEVEIRLYRIIYNAIEDMEAAMKGLLEPKYKESILGHAQVRATFKVTGVGTIAGCYVTDGKINRNSEVRIVRDGIVVHEGTLASLKRFKDDAKEVASGYECGIGIEKFNDLKDGDIIECFVMEEIKQ